MPTLLGMDTPGEGVTASTPGPWISTRLGSERSNQTKADAMRVGRQKCMFKLPFFSFCFIYFKMNKVPS